MEDYYQILGISVDASQEEIKKAFHRLARQFHPDVLGTHEKDDDYFKKITESYQTLSDPDQRRHYDIKRIVRTTEQSPKTHVQDAAFLAFQGFSEFLNDLLFKNEVETMQKPIQGQHLEAHLTVNFAEAYLGCQKSLSFKVPRVCSDCKGKGWPPKHPPQKCPECHGAKVRLAKGPLPFKRSCKRCNGLGQIQTQVCRLCNGSCLFTETETIEIEVPPGVNNETRLRLSKKGGSGLHGGERGDLLIQITVESDSNFVRNGNDLKITAPITISELLLGTQIRVKIPGDELIMRVPAGTDLGQSFRLKNKGFTSLKKETCGDLYVTLKLTLPSQIPESAFALIKQLTKIVPGF
jgi:molecular chaperone DnaJ